MYIHSSHKESANRFSIYDVETFYGMFYANTKITLCYAMKLLPGADIKGYMIRPVIIYILTRCKHLEKGVEMNAQLSYIDHNLHKRFPPNKQKNRYL